MEHAVKHQIWPAWAFAMILVVIVAAGPWQLGSDAGVLRVRPADPDAIETSAARESRWTGTAVELN